MANSLPLRLNNPFALRKSPARWLGKIESNCAFEQFETLELGVRAGLINLLTQMRKHKSLKDLIFAYAPPCENDSASYYSYILYHVVNAYQQLLTDSSAFLNLASAISAYECGSPSPISYKYVLTKYHIFEKHLALLNRIRK